MYCILILQFEIRNYILKIGVVLYGDANEYLFHPLQVAKVKKYQGTTTISALLRHPVLVLDVNTRLQMEWWFVESPKLAFEIDRNPR